MARTLIENVQEPPPARIPPESEIALADTETTPGSQPDDRLSGFEMMRPAGNVSEMEMPSSSTPFGLVRVKVSVVEVLSSMLGWLKAIETVGEFCAKAEEAPTIRNHAVTSRPAIVFIQ